MPEIKLLFSSLRFSGNIFSIFKKWLLFLIFCSWHVNHANAVDLEFPSRKQPDHFPSKAAVV